MAFAVEDDSSEARPLSPKGSLSFGRGGGAVPLPLPVSFFSDAPAEMRIEIEWDDTTMMATHFAGIVGEYFFPFFPLLIWGFAFSDFLLGGMN
jgi:hypothetical protein